MTPGPPTVDQKLNAQVRWDDFDPHAYIERNYLEIQAVDEEILSLVRDHFSDHFRDGGGRVASGIDVGAGPNLYPALAMLPWCDRITLLERSSKNLEYLRGQLSHYDPHWDRFWEVLCKDEAYATLDTDPRVRFKEAVQRPEAGSLFDLCGGGRRWDLGTMFFVAESITNSLTEFRRGVGCFMRALNPGAPFAAAFMEHSEGYRVGAHEFPARDVDESEVRTVLSGHAEDLTIHRMANPKQLVRDGYTGMILACGRRKK
ncbi:SCO2525 family SAM-dependent methyltransferase [Streptomyces sp. A012304]|uniref:SCO2525 family SAM-dependent methyltransferase n=1 Tax=Streptomyces sp. A012304 TaxID=375446 RepID=UPI00222F7852|nr:SCO2525 family SAM-dependent methyltransferase [Streptomyces sp. A012304]